MVDTSPRERELERERTREWLEALDDVIDGSGSTAARRLLGNLQRRAALRGVPGPVASPTPYVNTIGPAQRARPPGDLKLQRRVEAIMRWNAMAMVVRANRRTPGIGGHIATYASAATLFEVGFNHVFHGAAHDAGGDLVFFQGHAAPGVYARAFLEGRLSTADLDRFRQELGPHGGLPSYPHPWLMPGFWEMPSVSMGLAPIMAIYAARFSRYLAARGIVDAPRRVFALLGDGEMDEPEAAGALAIAAREGLENLTFVVNCNLQRLDGPVRPNRRVVDDLERLFAGAGWTVIKVLWADRWAQIFDADRDGLVLERLQDVTDADLQRWGAAQDSEVRAEFFGAHPDLSRLVDDWSDDDLTALFRDMRGGHDIEEVYAAYQRAQQSKRPAVILAQTVKGWGLGTAGESRNVAHKATTLDPDALRELRDRLAVPVADDALEDVPYIDPAQDAPERRYVRQRRDALGGPTPQRRDRAAPLPIPTPPFEDFHQGSERPATTTMIVARLLSRLLKDEELGPRLVPIIPDEARTFGIEALFPQIGIYQPDGAASDPVDAATLTPYALRERGQLLEEGITEAGAVASTIAAGTAYAVHGVAMVPFYFFYSMFGFQRVGDLLWAAQDARCRGFLIGATSGRTTLSGEGLQHQDGHSQLTALAHPRVRAYDPAYGYEAVTLIEHGLRRIAADAEDLLYYLTVTNEAGPQPPRPDGSAAGIVRGIYRLRPSTKAGEVRRVQLLASGAMVRQAIAAQERLADDYGVTADVWSVTSWSELYRDATAVARHNVLHPGEEPRSAYVNRCLGSDPGVVVAVSDYVRALPAAVLHWIDAPSTVLGTDGFGRSDDSPALRDFFEVDDRHIALAALSTLVRADRYPAGPVMDAIEAMGIDPDRPHPATV